MITLGLTCAPASTNSIGGVSALSSERPALIGLEETDLSGAGVGWDHTQLTSANKVKAHASQKVHTRVVLVVELDGIRLFATLTQERHPLGAASGKHGGEFSMRPIEAVEIGWDIELVEHLR
jgi:hypothetical protein